MKRNCSRRRSSLAAGAPANAGMAQRRRAAARGDASAAASCKRLGAAIRTGNSCCSTARRRTRSCCRAGKSVSIAVSTKFASAMIGWRRCSDTRPATSPAATPPSATAAKWRRKPRCKSPARRSTVDLAMAALGLGAQVGISLPFSREQEAEADILGIRYMQRRRLRREASDPVLAAHAAGRRLASAGIPVDAPRSRTTASSASANYINAAGLGAGVTGRNQALAPALLRPGRGARFRAPSSAALAQLVRALVCGTRCPRFEPGRRYQPSLRCELRLASLEA